MKWIVSASGSWLNIYNPVGTCDLDVGFDTAIVTTSAGEEMSGAQRPTAGGQQEVKGKTFRGRNWFVLKVTGQFDLTSQQSFVKYI